MMLVPSTLRLICASISSLDNCPTRPDLHMPAAFTKISTVMFRCDTWKTVKTAWFKGQNRTRIFNRDKLYSIPMVRQWAARTDLKTAMTSMSMLMLASNSPTSYLLRARDCVSAIIALLAIVDNALFITIAEETRLRS